MLRSESPIAAVNVHPVALPLVEVLVTSFGSDAGRDALRAAVLVELRLANGAVGWGECPVSWAPGYSYETASTARYVLREHFIPAVIGQPDLSGLRRFRGHPMARMGLEAAFWAAVAESRGMSLGDVLAEQAGGVARRARVAVGVSIGIQADMDATLAVIRKRLDEGYRRIKVKIRPGWDVEPLRAIRAAFPDITLMADANSAYTLDDAPHLRALDAFNLMMIEQPLGYMDLYQHSKLQPQLQTPICLDESIRDADDVRLAMAIGAGRIINLKPARVGGLTETLRIHALCHETGIPLWIGGMLETGVGRAVNLAVASLPGVTLPSDLSATNRYYDPDITDEVFTLNAADSTIDVPTGVGLGVHVNTGRLAAAKAAYERVQGVG